MTDHLKKTDDIQYAFGMFKMGNEWQVVKVPYIPDEEQFDVLIKTALRDEAIETLKMNIAKSGILG